MEIFNDVVGFSVAIGGFTATLVAFAKSPIGRFLGRALRREASDLMLAAAKEANEPLEQKANELDQKVQALDDYARYHLGPNGHTPALHLRIEYLEDRSRQAE